MSDVADPQQQPPQFTVAIAGNLPGKWECPNGHIIGVVLRERVGSRLRTRLLVFSGALWAENEVPAQAGRAKIDAGEVICGICGAIREWFPSEYLLDKLMASRKRHV